MILLSDVVGMVSSAFLLFSPAKDQYYRFLEFLQMKKGSASGLKTIRANLAAVWRNRRDAYDGWDSMWLAIGAILLLLSFILKLLGS